MKQLLSVVVPAYKEADTIAEALARLLLVLDRLDSPVEVIVVSDGNEDGTERAAAAVDHPRLRVLHYPENRGKGFAIRHGFEAASGELIAFIDADLDIHPEGILRFLEILEVSGGDAIVASKIHPDSRVSYPKFRRFQSRVFRRLVRTIFDLNVADTQTGLKLFRRPVLEECMPHVMTSGFAFDLELLVLASDADFAIAEGPIDLDFKFSTTTGSQAVFEMLADISRLQRRRIRSRRNGTWVTPAGRLARSSGGEPEAGPVIPVAETMDSAPAKGSPRG
ncbi:glycosyltransferase family 2 protein [Nocardioides gansuensis]|nr:glycosyltransferase family 2 protein [Nocardioides gansuensis]